MATGIDGSPAVKMEDLLEAIFMLYHCLGDAGLDVVNLFKEFAGAPEIFIFTEGSCGVGLGEKIFIQFSKFTGKIVTGNVHRDHLLLF